MNHIPLIDVSFKRYATVLHLESLLVLKIIFKFVVYNPCQFYLFVYGLLVVNFFTQFLTLTPFFE